jgi:hypothetical protein
MEHSLHIACKHFVEAIAPASLAAIYKKVKDVLQRASANGELDLHQYDSKLMDIGLESDSDPNNNESDDADTEFSSGDALGKALALVKQVNTHGIG